MASEDTAGDGTPAGSAPEAAGEPASGNDAAPASGAPGNGAPEDDAPSTSPASAPDEAAVPPTGSDHADADPEDAGPDGASPSGARKKKRRRRKKKPPAADARPFRKPATDRAPFHVGEEVFGKITAVLDHALMVDLAGKALAIFDRYEMEADDLVPSVGDRFVARVHNDGARGGLVVLTRKPLREEDAKPWVEQASRDGSLCPGLVTGAIKGGVEVTIGGLRAFAPASGMDLHPAEANFAALIGQLLDFKVSEYKGNGRDVVVTRRPMLEKEARARRKQALAVLEEGQVKKGVVRTVVEWGAFVALPEAANLEGLVHISEASHDPRARLDELLKPGDEIDVKILRIDDRGKIALSRKALIEDPWAEAKQKYAPRSRHTARVTRLEHFGAIVELEAGIEGLLHIADLSFKRIEHASEILQMGQEIEVLVNQFDPQTRRLSLHAAPTGDRANEEPQKIRRGAMLRAEVLKAEPAGLAVRVLGVTGRAARGFIPAGHTGTVRGTDLRKKFKQGSIVEAKVIELDPRRGEPKMSIRELAADEERNAHREYRKQVAAEASFGTLGDLLAAATKK